MFQLRGNIKKLQLPPKIKISIIMLTRLRGFLHGDCKDPVNGETACICDTVPVIIRTYIVFVFVYMCVCLLFFTNFSSNQALSPGVVIDHLAEKLTAR